MAASLKKGEHVAWNTSQGETKGKVVKKLTTKTKIQNYVAKASKSDPQYLVESDKTGAKAAHKPSQLKKTR
jgi:hypothetical protein